MIQLKLRIKGLHFRCRVLLCNRNQLLLWLKYFLSTTLPQEWIADPNIFFFSGAYHV